MFRDKMYLLLLLSSTWLGLKASQCDLFHNDLLCSLDPISNVVGAVFGLETELDCQQECGSTASCNFFMFAKFSSKPTDCFLLSRCNTSATCKESSDCDFSVTGPKTPLIADACCPEFREATCEAKSEIVHIFDVSKPAECQSLCRDTHGCGYWSLYGQICFLYSICESPSPCDPLCSGGPVLPNVWVCAEKVFFDTLLLGGETSTEDYSTSLELITNNATCSPRISRLPVARRFAHAAVLGSRIFHCGGLNGQFHHDCHSFDLHSDDNRWEEEAGLVLPRDSFGLSAVGDDTLVASGGRSGPGSLSSVEVFTLAAGWRLEPRLEMNATKESHCSVVLGSWLYSIGGGVGGDTLEHVSNLVEAFDTRLMGTSDSLSWVEKASMSARRYGHGCKVGVFDGEEGIFVAGGQNERGLTLDSAEFYNPVEDAWQAIGALNIARTFFQMTMLGDEVLASGGKPELLTSLETWNGTAWVERVEPSGIG